MTHVTPEKSAYAAYLARIKTALPELEVTDVHEAEGAGQFNQVLVVNETWIFRFPRYTHVIEELAREVHLLAQLAGHLPLPIPQPVYICLKPAVPGQAFSAYRKLPGITLSRARYSHLPEPQRRTVADQLGHFLRSLHGLPQETLDLPAQIHDRPHDWAKMYAEIHDKLFEYMRPQARRQVSAQFRAFLATARNLPFRPRLRHGDFGPSNVLFDPDRGQVSGILDFSSAGLGDPAVDLAAVSTYGDEFTSLFQHAYPPHEMLWARARFYRTTFALQEALAGLRDGDPRAFEAGIASYR